MFAWQQRLPQLQAAFAAAAPFPHVVIDDFADAALLQEITRLDFGDVGADRWTWHRYYSQDTWSRTDLASFAAPTRALFAALAAEPFRRDLAALSGIDGLLFDDALEDGGLQATAAGGHLFLHVDPLVHPRRRRWRRRLNLLVYLDDWDPAWGGALELWNAGVSRCVARVTPARNRAVLFASGPDTPHGFPDPLRCPAGVSRNCLAVYYFVEEAAAPPTHFGRFFARPGERRARVAVAAENLALHAYGRLGQTLGIDDALVNRVLQPFRRRR